MRSPSRSCVRELQPAPAATSVVPATAAKRPGRARRRVPPPRGEGHAGAAHDRHAAKPATSTGADFALTTRAQLPQRAEPRAFRPRARDDAHVPGLATEVAAARRPRVERPRRAARRAVALLFARPRRVEHERVAPLPGLAARLRVRVALEDRLRRAGVTARRLHVRRVLAAAGVPWEGPSVTPWRDGAVAEGLRGIARRRGLHAVVLDHPAAAGAERAQRPERRDQRRGYASRNPRPLCTTRAVCHDVGAFRRRGERLGLPSGSTFDATESDRRASGDEGPPIAVVRDRASGRALRVKDSHGSGAPQAARGLSRTPSAKVIQARAKRIVSPITAHDAQDC